MDTLNPFDIGYTEPEPYEAEVYVSPAPAVKPKHPGPKIHRNVEQGTPEWLAARCGVLTASEVKLILNPPPKEETRIKKNGDPYKQREWVIVADNDDCRKHLYELAAQRITKFVEPMFQSFDMIRGQVDEQEARARYAEEHGKVEEVGFITNDRWGFTLGYSPDGLVGSDGLIECKSRKQKYQVQTVVEHLTGGGIPAEYVMQHQTGLMVAERQWIDFVSYSEKLPMVVIRVHPDDVIQAAIREAAEAAEAKIAHIIKTFQEATQ